ncbi:MAG: YlxM family DNA-binding protein [Lachnospiraceae bacterium]|nr:YlxM family DNA-binding protein [Lachnospiraceae bacterium]
MEEFVKRSLLYDFYGDLLTDRQKEIYGAYVQEDLSLAEIAQEYRISRQGVHDLIRRVGMILDGYEEKLQLVAKFLEVKTKVKEIESCKSLKEAKEKAENILELL